jgi:hypothetical protein
MNKNYEITQYLMGEKLLILLELHVEGYLKN